jgi:CAAX amino terminal protease family.
MKRYKKLWFYILTVICAIVLGGMGTFLFDVGSQIQYAISIAMVQMSPFCGLLILCLFTRDVNCFREINLFSHITFKWILVAIGIPAIIVFGSASILSFMDIPYIQNGYSPFVLIVFIVTSLIGCIGEEIGWRGYLLPEFNKKYSLLLSSLFTGLLWGAWHFGKISMYGIEGYFLFILMISEFSVLMSWIYDRTRKNLLLMIVFHLTINVASIIMLNNREGLLFYIFGCILGGILCIAVVIRNETIFLNKMRNKV